MPMARNNCRHIATFRMPGSRDIAECGIRLTPIGSLPRLKQNGPKHPVARLGGFRRDHLPALAPAGTGIFLRRRWQDGVKNAEKLATGFRELWPQVDDIVT
jgi:hypothetical protein